MARKKKKARPKSTKLDQLDEEIDRYLETYRGTATTLALVEPTWRSGAQQHEPALLSA